MIILNTYKSNLIASPPQSTSDPPTNHDAPNDKDENKSLDHPSRLFQSPIIIAIPSSSSSSPCSYSFPYSSPSYSCPSPHSRSHFRTTNSPNSSNSSNALISQRSHDLSEDVLSYPTHRDVDQQS